MTTLDSLGRYAENLAPEALDASGGMLPPWYWYCFFFSELCVPYYL